MPGGQVPQGGHGRRLVSGAQLVGGFLVEDDLSDSVETVHGCPSVHGSRQRQPRAGHGSWAMSRPE